MFVINFQYAYLLLVVPFLIVWSLLFVFSKKTRKEQLFMSLLLVPFGPLSELVYFQDYWLPGSIFSFSFFGVPILFEDVLFAFTIGGIGSVIYEALTHKRLYKAKQPVKYVIGISAIALLSVLVAGLLFIAGMNSIFATAIGFMVAALLIVMQRKDLLIDSLLSGFIVMLTMFVAYVVLFNLVGNAEDILQQGWLLHGTRLDIRLFSQIPVTEMVWGFAWGLVAGPLYEFAKHLRFG